MLNKKGFKKGVAYVALFGVMAGSSFGVVSYVSGKAVPTGVTSTANPSATAASEGTNTNEGNTILNTSSVSTSKVEDVSGLVTEVMPSIVSITCTSGGMQQGYYGSQGSGNSVSAGTGIIVSQDKKNLYVATNNHVVEGASSVAVTFHDGTKVDATVKGTASSSDLAVVQIPLDSIKEETKNAIRIATLGDSNKAKVGEMVVAIGNALGYGQSVTVGYLSAKDREVQTDDYTMNLLQTDAAINPGNSGGALLNASGQVVGINSAKYSSEEVEGIGYAIPISYAIPIINDLISQEKVSEEDQGYLGVRFYEVTGKVSASFNIPDGIFISSVVENSPAAKAGLRAGDVVTSIDGRSVSKQEQFQEVLQTKAAGTKIQLTIQRQSGTKYSEKTISVTLGKKSDYAASDSSNSSNEENRNSQREQNPYYYFYKNGQ